MRRVLVSIGLLIALVAWWMHEPEARATDIEVDRSARTGDQAGLRDALGKLRSGRLPNTAFEIRPDGLVTITGTVIDRDTEAPVADVEVVFKNEGGEESVLADAGGVYRIDLAPGSYRAFVRDETVLSFGPPKFMRLPTQPEPEDVGVPDETAMPLVVASRDLDHVDLRVMRGGVVRGRVLDREGRPIARAIVRARGNQTRPVLGTDVVETDKDGGYELILPAGWWMLEAGHPAYAGVDKMPAIQLLAGLRTDGHDLTLVAGCVITGRVVGPDGKPANEGALEEGADGTFGLVGRIGAGGTFRFTTQLAQQITLRAWPWKSPASTAQTFACREGARFDNVVLQIPGRGPDIEGTLADAAGEPIALAFVDLHPLDPGGLAQQERSDLDGRFAVFQQPAGRYRVTVYVPGRGALSTVITAPAKDVRLTLGGVGRITGTVEGITNGSFDLRFTDCRLADGAVPITEDSRIVGVRDGKFALDGVPACKLTAIPIHAGSPWPAVTVDVKPNRTTTLALTLVAEEPSEVLEHLDPAPDVN